MCFLRLSSGTKIFVRRREVSALEDNYRSHILKKTRKMNIRYHIFCDAFLSYKDVDVNSFVPHTTRLWNSLPIECFPLIYDLSGFKSRISRHLLTVASLYRDFLYALIFLCSFFL